MQQAFRRQAAGGGVYGAYNVNVGNNINNSYLNQDLKGYISGRNFTTVGDPYRENQKGHPSRAQRSNEFSGRNSEMVFFFRYKEKARIS
jgi:hypothetical protein